MPQSICINSKKEQKHRNTTARIGNLKFKRLQNRLHSSRDLEVFFVIPEGVEELIEQDSSKNADIRKFT